MKQPWYAWLILSATTVTLSCVFWFALWTVPNHGRWLGPLGAALPVLIVLPFVIAEARRK